MNRKREMRLENDVDELVDSWINGNLNHTIDKILARPKATAIYFVAKMMARFDDNDRAQLVRMLTHRAIAR